MAARTLPASLAAVMTMTSTGGCPSRRCATSCCPTARCGPASTLHEPDQHNVDRVFGALRAQDQLAGAKGRSAHPLEAVERLLASSGQEMSAAQVAEVTGMSRATAQRYLSHLHEIGRVEIRLRYGSGGRPEHRYRWYRTGER